jgi:hypothetical protein
MQGIQKTRSEVILIREADGIEMGVLQDGTPFLTTTGLAHVCGVSKSVISEWVKEWSWQSMRPRDQKIAEILRSHGYTEAGVYIDTPNAHAHPEAVCMALIEYYAFWSDKTNDVAKLAMRALARLTFRRLVHSALGFDPEQKLNAHWRQFHDRVTLNAAPAGYFSVFREMSDIMVTAINNGMTMDSHTVPDISVGQAWSKYWDAENMTAHWGERHKWPHLYPDYFPQAKAGSAEAFIYPLAALGEFRSWLHDTYLPEKFPKYLHYKVNKGALPESSARMLLLAVTPKQFKQ